jgi:hypothetical protein
MDRPNRTWEGPSFLPFAGCFATNWLVSTHIVTLVVMRAITAMRVFCIPGFVLCAGLLLSAGCSGPASDAQGVCLDTGYCLDTYCVAVCGDRVVNELLSICDTTLEPARCDCECITQVGMGDACEDNRYCDQSVSSLGTFCCTDASQCGTYLDRCVENCSSYAGGPDGGEGALCQDDTECGTGLYCCRVPNDPANCDFTSDQSCTCLSTP